MQNCALARSNFGELCHRTVNQNHQRNYSAKWLKRSNSCEKFRICDITRMGHHVHSRNERPSQYYKPNSAFDGAAARINRMKRKKQRKPDWFAKRVAAEKAEEKQLMLALRAKDEKALACIAISVALSVLTV